MKATCILASYPRFKRSATKFVDSFTADDVAQETAYRLLRSERELEKDSDCLPYGLTTVRNLCFDELKRVRKFVPHSPNARATGEASVLTKLTCEAALNVLGPRQRTVVERRYFDDCSSAEIAAELGITVGLVNVLLSRGRKRMRAVLAS